MGATLDGAGHWTDVWLASPAALAFELLMLTKTARVFSL